MKTAVVILNWNGEKHLKRFLAPLLHSLEGYDAGVTIADNNSIDGSVAYVESTFEGRVQVLCFPRNYGFAEGYNRALSSTDARYYLLLNSDVLVEGDWLFALEEWMDLHEDCAACGPKILSYKERDRFEYAGAAGGLIDRFGYSFCRGRILSWTEKDEGQYDIPQNIFWCSGACMMVRSDAWKALGGFDGSFFAHFEEIDFCWRARLAGGDIGYVPRSRVWHVGGGTLPSDSPWKLRLNYRNNLLTLWKNEARTRAMLFFFEAVALMLPDEADGISPSYAFRLWLEEQDMGLIEKLCEQAAVQGLIGRKMLVWKRMVLDGLSALVYLSHGEKDKFRAVWEAHKEFKSLRKDIKEEGREDIAAWLLERIMKGDCEKMIYLEPEEDGKGTAVGIRGRYRGWMVPLALRKKEKAHEFINKDIRL